MMIMRITYLASIEETRSRLLGAAEPSEWVAKRSIFVGHLTYGRLILAQVLQPSRSRSWQLCLSSAHLITLVSDDVLIRKTLDILLKGRFYKPVSSWNRSSSSWWAMVRCNDRWNEHSMWEHITPEPFQSSIQSRFWYQPSGQQVS